MRTIVLTTEGVKILVHSNKFDAQEYIENTYGYTVQWQGYQNDVSIAPQVIALPEDLEEELTEGEHIDNLYAIINTPGEEMNDGECLISVIEYVKKHFN